MADQFVSNPLDVLKVGQEVKAKVIEVDLGRKRIALSLKTDAEVNHDKGQRQGHNGPKRQSNHRPSNQHTNHRGDKAPKGNNPFAGLKGLNLKGR